MPSRAGLGHDALIRRDDQQHEINACSPGHHVADKALVPGHIHHAHAFAVRQRKKGEAQFDGDASALFLIEAVAVDAGQGPDQRGFAVVDVTGGAHYDCHVDSLSHRGRRAPDPVLKGGEAVGQSAAGNGVPFFR